MRMLRLSWAPALWCAVCSSARAALIVGSTDSKVTVIDEMGGGTLYEWSVNRVGVQNAVGVEYDLRNGYVYVGGANFHTVVRARLDGSSPVTLTSASDPYFGGNAPGDERLDLALDVAGGRVFFTTGWGGDVCVGNLDGSGGTTVLFGDQGGALNGIEYNPLNDMLYFARLSGEGPGIYAANANGSGTPALLFGGSDFRQLTLDPAAGTIYWTDWANGNILAGSMSGGTAAIVFSGLSYPYGIDLDVAAGRLYWADALTGNIYSGGTSGTGKTLIQTVPDARGVAFVVPEPGTVALLWLGGVGLALGCWRTRR